MTYRLACILLAIVVAVLAAILLIAPGLYTSTYGVSADTGGMFMGRRAAPGFLGLALLLWLLRDVTDKTVQHAVCISMVVMFAGIALTGTSAFLIGTASWTILLAAFAEVVIAVSFWFVRPKT
jgi:hypothetical protein